MFPDTEHSPVGTSLLRQAAFIKRRLCAASASMASLAARATRSCYTPYHLSKLHQWILTHAYYPGVLRGQSPSRGSHIYCVSKFLHCLTYRNLSFVICRQVVQVRVVLNWMMISSTNGAQTQRNETHKKPTEKGSDEDFGN